MSKSIPLDRVVAVASKHPVKGNLVEVVARYERGDEFPPVVQAVSGDLGAHDESILVTMADDVYRFNSDLLGLPVPGSPQVLQGARREWAEAAMAEEVDEFREASVNGRVDEAADALIDLVYFALGRLQEMGVAPLPVFKEVHAANMTKRRGELSKRPGSMGYDAVKPEGWTPPDHSYLLGLKGEHVPALQALARGEKFLVGHKPTKETVIGHIEVDQATGEKPLLSEEDLLVLNTLSPALREATLLRARKAQDYRQGFATLKDYFPFGLKSHAQMIHTKDLRLMNLVSTERAPNHEGIRDTALDLINYATFLIEDLDGVIDGTRGAGERA